MDIRERRCGIMDFKGEGIVIKKDTAIQLLKTCAKVCNEITQKEIEQIIEKEFDKILPIAFLCDRRACKKCSFPTCKHTFNIKHAKNFESTKTGIYTEKELGVKGV